MEPGDMNEERRRYVRKKVKVTALLKMGVHLNGRGYTKDVCRGGMCLVAPGMFQFIKPAQMSDFLGAHVKVMFPAQSLTVSCTLVRLDLSKGECGLLVTGSSNDEAWEGLCRV